MDLPKLFADKYQRGEELAARSSATLYHCVDKDSGSSYALKVFHDVVGSNQEYIDAFNAELEAFASLSNKHVALVVDGGVQGAHCFLVMEFVEGKTLRELLKSHQGSPKIEQAVMLIEQISTALDAFHKAGVVHGHLDSRAILVDGDSVKVAGFYPQVIAKIRRTMTSADGFIVDPGYISPEQVSGASEPDFRTDLYAIGILLFEMLTGKKPFIAGNAFQAAMMRVAEEPPSPSMLNPEINPILDAAVVKAMAKIPENRFQSFADFIDAVRAGTSQGGSAGTLETASMSSVDNSGRIGSETVGVGISTDEIRKMLEQRDSTTKTAESSSVSASKAVKTSIAAKSGTSKSSSVSAGSGVSNAVPQAATVGPQEDGKLSSPEGAETVVGEIDVSDLPASFMIVSGPKRGTRFMLESDQSLLGRDDSCTVQIDQKDVPARYAIIVRKGQDYVIAPVSSAGVRVNSELIDSDSDHTLVRGDVVDIGPCSLRYVAPGEVFTLKDDIADRVVDRPASKISGAMKMITGLIAVLCLGLIFLFQQGISDREAAIKKAASSSSSKKRETIAKLRQLGDSLYKEGKLVEPVGENARTRFEQILEIDPEDTYAKRRLEEIKSRVASLRQQRRNKQRVQKKIEQLLAQAKQYFERGNFVSPPGSNAQDTLKDVLRIDPKNENAIAGLKKIDEKLGSMLGQVNSLLAQARMHRKEGRIISPANANAHASIKRIMELNPGNREAQELLLDMAAECIYRGDAYKKKARPSSMKNEYLKAQMLGVDPEYLAPRMRGADLMKRSSANVIIFDGGSSDKKSAPESGSGYLSTAEIESRIASWKLKDQISGGTQDSKFIELR